MSEPSAEEMMAYAAEQHRTMEQGIALSTTGWSVLEAAFAHLLSASIDPPDEFLGYTIYYSPSNTETRFRIVDAVFREILAAHPEREQIVATWATIINAVYRAKDTRNKIAHGTLCSISGRRPSVRLVDPIYSAASRQRDAKRPRQLPGLSAHDVNQAAGNFFDLARRVEAMVPYASLMRWAHLEAWRQKSAERAESPPTPPPLPSDPTPPIP
jgi:hypothetical protein